MPGQKLCDVFCASCRLAISVGHRWTLRQKQKLLVSLRRGSRGGICIGVQPVIGATGDGLTQVGGVSYANEPSHAESGTFQFAVKVANGQS